MKPPPVKFQIHILHRRLDEKQKVIRKENSFPLLNQTSFVYIFRLTGAWNTDADAMLMRWKKSGKVESNPFSHKQPDFHSILSHLVYSYKKIVFGFQQRLHIQGFTRWFVGKRIFLIIQNKYLLKIILTRLYSKDPPAMHRRDKGPKSEIRPFGIFININNHLTTRGPDLVSFFSDLLLNCMIFRFLVLVLGSELALSLYTLGN